MNTTEMVTLGIAAYAAVISTFVLGWDAYKWLSSGPKIRITGGTGYQIVGGLHPDPNTYVSVTAVNLGDRATTITNLGFLYYDSWFKANFRRKKTTKAFIITSPSQSQRLPYRFENGDQWVGFAEQDDHILNMIKDGYLYLALYHSHGGRDVRCRLMPKPAKSTTAM
ncbi:MAG: hypothetical protein Q8M93_04335 [Polaromonas sp.]|uniref:hypothetical protein n=1 Tax=Polaromonas sp. TaxID=1869339 RepID=UPI00273044D5|nr:hypothetical protein [Polaromonas sp.]MDP2451496.1 hypothetical protein [Polaromonas sp.]MDP3246172.1 hypothetical protein [Polaromonas sp.]MDP3753958.1 hypothetical protein [Polaromonas sp.]MDP3826174.1 hypothetical protein [Polaromonas sp.]